MIAEKKQTASTDIEIAQDNIVYTFNSRLVIVKAQEYEIFRGLLLLLSLLFCRHYYFVRALHRLMSVYSSTVLFLSVGIYRINDMNRVISSRLRLRCTHRVSY
jgi:hypothetical protein